MSEQNGHEEALTMIDEARLIEPPDYIRESSYVSSFEEYQRRYRESAERPETFWESVAEELRWFHPWDEVISGSLPDFEFYSGGKLNVCDNCVDRHVETHRRNKAAIIWEGEDGSRQILTYQMLQDQVCRFANVLKKLGLQKGDVVCVYMQNLPETFVALLACLRLGVIYNTVFAGFSAEALRERINDSQAKVLVTADVSYRRGNVIPLKETADEAMEDAPSIEKVILFRRGNVDVPMTDGRDLEWEEEMAEASAYCAPEHLDANEPGILIYTSGTSGRPKGIVHAGGGFLAGTYAYTKYPLDIRDRDVFWNTADVGWLTSHIWVVVGGLATGATNILYEGALDYPHQGRVYEMVERYRVNKLFSAPTAFRAFVRFGEELLNQYDLSSLELFASVGEPLSPGAWEWVYENLGGGKAVIVNTWGQTETGGVPLSGLPGAVPMKPGSCGVPFFGHEVDIVDENGEQRPEGVPGNLIIRNPFPTLARDVYRDRERYLDTYFSQVPGAFFTGDEAVRDSDGQYWVLGRADDVINVAGHRLSTMEMESALISHPKVVEAAVIGQEDPDKGTVPTAFVLLESGATETEELEDELKQKVVERIGTFARPAEVHVVDALPRTRSGKIVRRMLRELVQTGEVQSDTTSLEDEEVLDQLVQDLQR